MKEKELYEPAKKAIIKWFNNEYSAINKSKRVGMIKAWISANKIPREFKRNVSDDTLLIFSKEKDRPDIVGTVYINNTCDIFTAEVKNREIKVKDIYQLKRYAELLKAKHAFLISPEPLPEEIRRVIKRNPSITSYSAGHHVMHIPRFDVEKQRITEIEAEITNIEIRSG